MNPPSIFPILRFFLRWSPVVLFAAIIFAFSSMSSQEVDRTYNEVDKFAQPASSTPLPGTPLAHTLTPGISITPSIRPSSSPSKPTAVKPALTPRPVPTAMSITYAFRRFPIFRTLDFLKVGHFIGYFLLGLVTMFALPRKWRFSPLLAAFLCMLYAITDEIHQLYVAGRTSRISDVFLDSLAALAGAGLLYGIYRLQAYYREKRKVAAQTSETE